jgi:hypothetical protein
MTLIPLLRTAEFVSTIATHTTVLVFSFLAFRRTKLRPFALWIVASTIGIVLMSGWYMRSISPRLPPAEYMTYEAIYRVGFIVDSILAATGTVMLIRYVLAKSEFRSIPSDPTN